MLWEFTNNKNTPEIAKNFRCVYDRVVNNGYQIRSLFSNFRFVDISLGEEPKPDCSADCD